MARMIRTAAFDLGCLTRSVHPSQSVEAKSGEEQHLVRFAYSGNKSGNDRSVRGDAMFPTKLPKHNMPFTSMCWVRREQWESMCAQAARERRRATQMPTTFVKATSLLAASTNATESVGSKRKHSAASASAAVVGPSSSSPGAIARSHRKSLRGEDDSKVASGDDDAAEEPEEHVNVSEAAASLAEDTAALVDAAASFGDFVPVARLSLVAYFEVMIEKERVDESTSDSALSRPGRRGGRAAPRGALAFQHVEQCVAIGLGTSRYRLAGKQPGWDRQSFGWHSDDGDVFHGSGSGIPYASSFGVGDVVGCGLNYATGEIFFTRNGLNLGVAFQHDLSRTSTSPEDSSTSPALSLYPLIGLDSVWDITVNFGDAFPFAFDVVSYDKEQMDLFWKKLQQEAAQEEQQKKETSIFIDMKESRRSSASVAAAATPAAAAVASTDQPVPRLVHNYQAFMKAKSQWSTGKHVNS